MCPYLWTACSNAIFTTDPFILTRSKVPPNGKTVRISSIVIEPEGQGKCASVKPGTLVLLQSGLLLCRKEKMHRTVFVALIYRGSYGAAIEHTHAHVIPLQLTRILDVVINLSMQRGQTRYAAVTVLSWNVLLSRMFDNVHLSPTISLSAVYHSSPCPPPPETPAALK